MSSLWRGERRSQADPSNDTSTRWFSRMLSVSISDSIVEPMVASARIRRDDPAEPLATHPDLIGEHPFEWPGGPEAPPVVETKHHPAVGHTGVLHNDGQRPGGGVPRALLAAGEEHLGSLRPDVEHGSHHAE